MKTIPASLLEHYQQRTTTLAYGLYIKRRDGQQMGVTSDSANAVIDGITYAANPGLDVSAIVITAGMSVGNLELSTLHDGSVFYDPDLLSGVWNYAEFQVFRYNTADLTQGKDVLLAGHLGELKLIEGMIRVEMRDLRQFLQHNVGALSQRTCRNRFGVFDAINSWCPVDASQYTMNFTVTGVTSDQVFTSSNLVAGGSPIEVGNGHFNEGVINWTTGNNAGLSHQVRDHQTAGGQITMNFSASAAIQVGDTGTIQAGCMKRLLEDCSMKYGAWEYFNGEPHRPGLDKLTSKPEPDV